MSYSGPIYYCKCCGYHYHNLDAIPKCINCGAASESQFPVSEEKCFFCQNQQSNGYEDANSIEYDCPTCGRYVIAQRAALPIPDISDFSLKAPAIAAERKLQGRDGYTISLTNNVVGIGGVDFLHDYPMDFEDKLDRSLCNLFRLLLYPENEKRYEGSSIYRYFFATTYHDAEIIVKTLERLGYIHADYNNAVMLLSLTYDGWKAAKKIHLEPRLKNSIFIAMWFSAETAKYRSAIKNACSQAGYNSVIVDEDHHDNFIMDHVLNRIRESRLVIADFTCIREKVDEAGKNPSCGVRGGVYFEAGYAKGLGRHLIVTSSDDDESKQRIHFDIQQLNTIFWKNLDDKVSCKSFVDTVRERIVALVGWGHGNPNGNRADE